MDNVIVGPAAHDVIIGAPVCAIEPCAAINIVVA